MRPQRRAYTLLEVTLVLTVVVVASALAMPAVLTMYNPYKVRAATDTIRGSWADARMHAIEQSRPYRFAVKSETGSYRIAPDDPAYWSGSPPDNDDQNPAYIKEDELPAGIRFTGVSGIGDSSSGQWTKVAVFQSDGTAGDGCDMDVKMDNQSYTLTLSLRGLTGTSTVRKKGS